jgi:hypothetical protein
MYHPYMFGYRSATYRKSTRIKNHSTWGINRLAVNTSSGVQFVLFY